MPSEMTLALRLVFTAGKVACRPHHADVVSRCFMLLEIALLFGLVVASGEVAFLPHHVDVVPCCFMTLEITLPFGLVVASWEVAFLPHHVDVVLCCFTFPCLTLLLFHHLVVMVCESLRGKGGRVRRCLPGLMVLPLTPPRIALNLYAVPRLQHVKFREPRFG